jgi:hypothetical protein
LEKMSVSGETSSAPGSPAGDRRTSVRRQASGPTAMAKNGLEVSEYARAPFNVILALLLLASFGSHVAVSYVSSFCPDRLQIWFQKLLFSQEICILFPKFAPATALGCSCLERNTIFRSALLAAIFPTNLCSLG